MEHVGLGLGRLFVGGWSQYGHASHLPVETNHPLRWLQRRHSS
jgi:3-mercaptopyruvate sulfurtransferase SseA